MVNRDFIRFVCKALISDQGENIGYEFVTGQLTENTLRAVLEDDVNRIEILKDPNSSRLEVRIYGECTSAGKDGNPAFNVTDDGEVIRCHGELGNAWYLFDEELRNYGFYDGGPYKGL